jgi:hypothetical protein
VQSRDESAREVRVTRVVRDVTSIAPRPSPWAQPRGEQSSDPAIDRNSELLGQGFDNATKQRHHPSAIAYEYSFEMAPDALLSHLHRADGSATYSHNGYSLIGAVNGPIEVQRRDEMPEEATIEVNVRPAVGVGSKDSH